MDDPMMLALVAVLVVAVVVLVLVKKNQSSTKSKKTSAKSKVVSSSGEENSSESNALEEGEWDWGVSSRVVDDTKVSVQDVDALTEFNVYKQFGYFDKAAESLTTYLQNNPNKLDAELANELVGLWLEAKNVDAVADTLMQYQSHYSSEQLTEHIKAGLILDENHLGLRVLAENSLGWGVKETAEQIGENTLQKMPEQKDDSRSKRSRQRSVEDLVSQASSRYALVQGNANLGELDSDEKGAVLAFMNPEKSVRLLSGLLNYDVALKYLNKAIRSSTKPAALLIDALTLDYKNQNINRFAGHLWNLYYSLGQYGRQVKERMLGWGYSLGQHPLFETLEANPSEAVLRDVGIQQGFIDSGNIKKSRYQSLVVEKSDLADVPRTPVERILKESESLLMYGQLENSMEVLENAILEYPQESQLYITLFNLYERAEEWNSLEDMLQKLRSQVQTLPEEVVLAMSQLLQKFNNGSFGH